MPRHLVGLALGMAVLSAVPRSGIASGTAYWELATRDALADGDTFENVMLTAEGELRLGAAVETLKVEGERQLWSLCRARDGAVYAGTASGKILRIEGNKVETAFATEELLVTSIVEGKDGLLYAASIPNGKIFRRDGAGTWGVFATPPCKYIWALLPHPDKHLVAATGPEGKLFTIDALGRFEVFYDTGKENILSMALGESGELYFGTGNPGLLHRLSKDGKASILRDFGEGEVRVIRVRKGGLAVGVNSGVKASPASFLGAVQQAAQKAEAKDGVPKTDAPSSESGGPKPGAPGETPSPVSSGPAVRGAVLLITPDGRVEHQTEFAKSYVTDLAVTDAGVVVGTNNSGRVHRLDEDARPTLLWDFRENQILCFAGDGGRLAAVGTGDGAALRRIGEALAAAGYFQTKPFDAKFIADWGNLTWRGKGRPAFLTRSGNVAEPDKTWSDWTPPASGNTIKVASPRGRYLQLKVAWDGDASAVLTGVTVAYLPENQRPRVLDVRPDAAPGSSGLPAAPGGAAPPGGAPGPAFGGHGSMRKIAWRAEDPDGDPLAFRLAYRAEDTRSWVPLNNGDPVSAMEYLWNTDSVPDGRYLLRVEASDEPSNAADRALKASRESAPFTIDHRRPEVAVRAEPAGGAVRVTGAAEDAISHIARLEYSVDGAEWKTLFPRDRIFDDRKEEFEFSPGALSAGTHVITVRAVDQETNTGAASVTVTVP